MPDTPQSLSETPAPVLPAPAAEPSPTSAGTLSPLSQQTLKEFPLGMANSWVYQYRAYSGDQNTIWQVADTVVDVRTHPPYIAAQIERQTTLLEGSPVLQPRPSPGSFWYVIDGEAVYRVEGELVWDQVRLGSLELQFPLPGDQCWFTDPQQRAQSYDPNLPGCRKASGPTSLKLPAGSFDRCYQLVTPFNNGSIRQSFCSGVGLVQEQFDHVGSPFGYALTLTAYAFQ